MGRARTAPVAPLASALSWLISRFFRTRNDGYI